VTPAELEQLRPRLIAFAARTWGWDDAADLAAEVCATAALRLVAGQPTNAAWVWGQLRYRALDLGRRRGTQHEAPNADLPTRGARDVYDESDPAGTAALLAGMTAQQRQVVLLRADGLNLAQTATRLGITADAVQHLRLRARLSAERTRAAGALVAPAPAEPLAVVLARAPPALLLPRHGHARRQAPDRLSWRELEVLILLAAGLEQSAIGELLKISRETVKNQLAAAYGKLQVHNAPHAVAIGFRLKLLS